MREEVKKRVRGRRGKSSGMGKEEVVREVKSVIREGEMVWGGRERKEYNMIDGYTNNVADGILV